MPFFHSRPVGSIMPYLFWEGEKKMAYLIYAIGVIFFGFIKRKYILLGSKIFGSKEKINNATYDLRHKTC